MVNDEMVTYAGAIELPNENKYDTLTDRKKTENQPNTRTISVVPSAKYDNAVRLSVPQMSQAEILFKARLDALSINSHVHHKKFGKGVVVKINKNEKFIYIKFLLGEKKFIFPDAFISGFLEMI